MNKKFFWYEALKAGTIIGLVSTAFALLLQPLQTDEPSIWYNILDIVSWIVFILLVFGFTKRMGALQPAEKGFSYGQGIGFVVASMIFVGVISGLYSTVMANFFIKDEVLANVDKIMVMYQDMMPDEMFDSAYAVAKKSVLNPFYITMSSILSSCFIGFLISLFVAAITRRQPDIFASAGDNTDNSNQ